MVTNNLNSVYSPFYDYKQKSHKGVPEVYSQNDSIGIYSNPIASVNISDIQNAQNQKKSNSLINWGIGIGTTLVVLGALSVVLTRGGTGKYAKKIAEWSQKVDSSIASKTAKKESLNIYEKGKLFFDKGLKRVLRVLKSITNFTPYKDTFFDRLFTNKYAKKLKLDKIPQYCKNLSRRITMRTNTRCARTAINSADDLFAHINSLSHSDLNKRVTINGVEHSVQEWLTKAKELASSIKSGTSETFGTVSRNARIADVDANLKEMNVMQTLRAKLYPEFSGNKDVLTKSGKQALQTVKDGYATENLTAALREKAAGRLGSSCQPTLDATQELEKILKGLYPEAEANKHVSVLEKFTKTFKKASEFEKGVYLRQAELEAGAALTDFGGLALLAGTGVVATATQDSHEKTVSKALTFGIPVIGTAGLCLLQTSLGMTGILPLVLAIAGGKLLNIFGSAVSDKYIAAANSKKQFMQELDTLRLMAGKNNPFVLGTTQA